MHPYQQQLIKRYQRHAKTYLQHAFILQEIGDRLLSRLAYLKLIPETIVDLGCGIGYDAKQLQQCYSTTNIIAVDFSQNLLQQANFTAGNIIPVAADAQHLPIVSKSVDLIFANLLLPAIVDYPALWQECSRILKPGGILLFSSLGVDSFKELRQCAQDLQQHDMINAFIDLHDIGDSLMQAQFSDPVIDRETLTLTYPNLQQLLAEIKALGSMMLLAEYTHQFKSKIFWQALANLYQQRFANTEGRLPVTLEVYYGIAFAPSQQSISESEVSISIQSIKRRKPEVA